MRNKWFSIRKRGFFRPGQEIKGLRGGVHRYAAQVRPQIDTARAEKDRFRMKTKYGICRWDPSAKLFCCITGTIRQRKRPAALRPPRHLRSATIQTEAI
jgi:hypothetical protein